jgi:hypothetical protein
MGFRVEGIRPFEVTDIPQVAALHRRIFGIPSTPDIDSRYNSYFTDKFLAPVRRGALPSLVFEVGKGQIAGFIAVATRSFKIDHRVIQAAVSSQFVVEPQARSTLIAVALLRDFLNGPQDFSFTDEANETSRRLWEKLGGATSTLYSTHWIAPLRPMNLALSRFRSGLGSFAILAERVADLFDDVVSRIPGRWRLHPQTDLQSESLHAEELAKSMSQPNDGTLRPVYEVESLNQLLDDTAQPNRAGKLQKVLLRRNDGQVAGWYLYCLNPRGIAEVLQVGCRDTHQAEVIKHLFTHAGRGGASALAGRLEPHLAKAISRHFCLLSRREHSMLVHSRNSQILNAIHSGKAFISRLEGEWCLRFH